MSSRFMMAPSLNASRNSSSAVSFEENMILCAGKPASAARVSSGREEQSAPKPALHSNSTMRLTEAGSASISCESLFWLHGPSCESFTSNRGWPGPSPSLSRMGWSALFCRRQSWNTREWKAVGMLPP